ncbi:MAG: 30S ribosomal protein S20 [Patescibacteria group bacterium]
MPISKSAKKSLRVAQHKTSINRYRKALIKAALKNVTAENASKAISMIDKGVKWNLFHQNKAARMKSALAKQLPDGSKIAPRSTEKPVKVAPKKTKTVATKPTKKAVKVKSSKPSNKS